MELTNEQACTPTQSCTSGMERRNSSKVDYYSELRIWVEHAILEAERNKNFSKRDELLSLLKDL